MLLLGRPQYPWGRNRLWPRSTPRCPTARSCRYPDKPTPHHCTPPERRPAARRPPDPAPGHPSVTIHAHGHRHPARAASKMLRSAPPQSDSSLTHDHEHACAAAPRTSRPMLPAPRMRRPPRCTDNAPAAPVGLSRCLVSAVAKPADNTAGRASGIRFWRNKDPPRTICLPNPSSGGRYALRPMRDLLLPR